MAVHPQSICIVTGNHLCHNPRVLKEADTLSRLGYDVRVLGAAFDADLSRRDAALMNERPWRFTPVVDMTCASAAVPRHWLRLRRAALPYARVVLRCRAHCRSATAHRSC